MKEFGIKEGLLSRERRKINEIKKNAINAAQSMVVEYDIAGYYDLTPAQTSYFIRQYGRHHILKSSLYPMNQRSLALPQRLFGIPDGHKSQFEDMTERKAADELNGDSQVFKERIEATARSQAELFGELFTTYAKTAGLQTTPDADTLKRTAYHMYLKHNGSPFAIESAAQRLAKASIESKNKLPKDRESHILSVRNVITLRDL